MIKTIYNRSVFSALSSFCVILILLSGCATNNRHYISSPVPEEVKKQIRHVLIVPAKFDPQIRYQHFAKGRDVGAVKGIGVGGLAGALVGASPVIFFSILPAEIGQLLLSTFVTGGAVIGVTVGGIAGSLLAVPRKKAREIEEVADNAFGKLDCQGTLVDFVYMTGNNLTDYKYTISKGIGPDSQEEIPAYCNLNLEGIDIIIEVRVISLGFIGGNGSNPLISIDMNVNTRTINVTSGEEIGTELWHYVSRERPLSEWVENNSQLLHDELEHCYHSLAENIIEGTFLLYKFHVDSTRERSKTCVLQPIYPEYRGEGSFGGGLKYPEVDSLQPTLEWEPFPREKDINGDKNGMLNRIDEITYDLKIWKEQDFVQNEPLYTRQGIGSPKHKIEVLLEPSKKYYWTFRARFRLDDQYRVTKWAHSRLPSGGECNLNYIPATNYYRFKTPSE
jgi:hypothetical protein